MKGLSFLLLFCLSFSGRHREDPISPGEFCGIRNNSTKDGEAISYQVYYSLAGIYVNAGWASFTNKLENMNGRPVYHVTGSGGTYTSYDWIYRVRDIYESYIDTADMLPVKFTREVDDGGKKKSEKLLFNHSAHTVTTEKGQIKIPACVQDVLSMIYYARNIDFSGYKPGDKIPFKMFLENETHEMYIRYLGKEEIKTKYGKFHSIRFRPLLVAGTIFSGGEDMTVWVSDDPNHVPVRIESPILVGTIKVDMMDYRNLRHPLSGLIKKKS
jgi:hypothetical protein